MRDPDLVLRAQRAAAALEQAWDRHRTLHGLGPDPMPAISSYVGYSLEEPWGEPRVVLGVAAEEAEQIAALLDGHDCAARAAAGSSHPEAEQPGAANDAVAEPGLAARGGHVHVPAQPQPVSPKRARSKEQARPERSRGTREQPRSADRPAAPRSLSPLEPGSAVDSGLPLAADSGRDAEPGDGLDAAPHAAAQPDGARRPTGFHATGSGYTGLMAVPGDADLTDLTAFRPRHEPASYLDEGPEPDPFFAEPDGRMPIGRTRGGRVAGSHAMPRQKRSSGPATVTGSLQRASRPQEGAGRRGLTSVAAELAGWASSELPGQAAHRFAPHPPAGQYGSAADPAPWPNAGLPGDPGI